MRLDGLNVRPCARQLDFEDDAIMNVPAQPIPSCMDFLCHTSARDLQRLVR